MTENNKKSCDVICLEEVDSTNEEAKRRAVGRMEDEFLVVAEKQTSGKGRRGRSWESPSGGNVYMSLLLRPSFGKEAASMVTLVMALSVAEAIRELTGLQALIKWPNDIVVNRKKVVGILTELCMEEDGGWYLVCGVGINVNQKEFPEELTDTATSLWLESRKETVVKLTDMHVLPDNEEDRDNTESRRIIDKVMKHFWKNYDTFGSKADMSGLTEAYNMLLVNKDASVRVLDPKGEYEGTAFGINEQGELLVQKQDGSMENVYAGEVSVRGIYGYV